VEFILYLKQSQVNLNGLLSFSCSFYEQVVPFGKFQTAGVSTVSNSTPENEGHELLSQLPESFRVPKSVRRCILRDR
jgi:hypothetical protein